ncbi:protein B160 [Actinidia rufa]|uniref:Protein B160 n=1 Tax=Actinidia rufa TaxID=165716 RepID=A0A7J0F1L1_9ERIC|nr:protein B160 [Actinidia rufa]
MDEEEALPDHLRCKRTDGRQWRCSRRVMEGKKLCEVHHLQGRHRQHKEKVPDSLKLQRKKPRSQIQESEPQIRSRKREKEGESQEIRVRKREKVGVSEALDEALRKMKLKRGDLQLELIRVFLERQVEKKKERELRKRSERETEVMKELPYGVMEISPALSQQNLSNAGALCNVKVGFDSSCVPRRCFRSKNIEPIPISTMQGEMLMILSTYHTFQDLLMNKMRVDKIQQLHYLIYMLLPVLEQINQEQNIELELEAKLKGKTVSEVQIQQAEFCSNKLHCCNNCKTSVVDFHRSCRNCEYKLCLSCAKLFRESLPRVTKAFISKPRYRSKTCRPGDKLLSKKKPISTSRKASPKWKACNDDGGIVCPPLAFGGCGEGLLDLNCVFPLSWTKELEVNAKRIVCTYDLPEPSDVSLCCSLCMSMDDKASKRKLLRGAASREDSNDNCLYFPAVQDLRDESLEHFQKHWSKGHPVIVRRVLKSTPELSWDPVVMFCTYLEKSSSRSGNDKAAVTSTNCLDWCEIEICRKQIFMGSLEGKSHANMHYEMLKLKVLLSSYLFQEQFPDHHAEIIRSLPLQDYLSGLLNLAANSLLDAAKPDLGPRLYISFGSPDNLTQADFLTKLCYNSHDVVNILMHTTDVPISTEQLTKIRNLMKTYNTHDQKMENEGEDRSSVLSDNTEESGLQDTIEKGFPLSNGVAKVSLFTGVSQNAYSSSVKDANMSRAQGHDSASDSEGSIFRYGITRRSQELDDQNFFRDRSKSPNCSWEKSEANSSGAQWDIFRRQDVPKLLEYLSTHSNEFSHTYRSPEQVVHPILDQSFYLDAAHKIRLNEEFNIEPWTFEQHLGEAVIIPAGCPYQIRKLKSCVNVVLDFISPENTSECIRLTDELHLLPVQHKARKNILEVKKMSLSSICTAVKEIDNLTGAE